MLYEIYISKEVIKVILLVHHQGIKTPRRPVRYQAKDCAHVVAQYELHKKTCVHETGALKYFLILSTRIGGWRILEVPILVDAKNFFRHVL